MMITFGAMTNRLDRLKQRGLVKRTKSPTDSRQVRVTLTRRGMQKVAADLVDHAANRRAIIAAERSGRVRTGDTIDGSYRRMVELHHAHRTLLLAPWHP